MNGIVDTDLDPITAMGIRKNSNIYEDSLHNVMNKFLILEDECNKVVMNAIKSKEQRGNRFVEYRKIDLGTFKRMETALNELRAEQQRWFKEDEAYRSGVMPNLSVKD